MLIKSDPNRKRIRNRGVNKRIMFEVFERDKYQCHFCGRTADDDDPFREGHKIILHVGHIKPHKSKTHSAKDAEEYVKLTKDDFITMCSVCNEGAKNKQIKIITLLDRVLQTDKKEKKLIYLALKKIFEQN